MEQTSDVIHNPNEIPSLSLASGPFPSPCTLKSPRAFLYSLLFFLLRSSPFTSDPFYPKIPQESSTPHHWHGTQCHPRWVSQSLLHSCQNVTLKRNSDLPPPAYSWPAQSWILTPAHETTHTPLVTTVSSSHRELLRIAGLFLPFHASAPLHILKLLPKSSSAHFLLLPLTRISTSPSSSKVTWGWFPSWRPARVPHFLLSQPCSPYNLHFTQWPNSLQDPPAWPVRAGITSCVRACLVTSVVSDSLWPYGLQPARLLWPWESPGKNTGVGCHALLQGIFPTQELNPHLPCLLHCRCILYCWATREARIIS